MDDFEKIAAQYIAVWNESDPDRRRSAVADLWVDGGTYVDPMVAATGHAEIDATIGSVQAQFPGFEFRLHGPVDGHHDQARFQWELGPATGEAPIVGFDVIERSGDGRLARVLGFLDKVPAA